MTSLEENLDRLARAVLGEARAEAEQILSDARAKAEGIRQRAQQQAAAERAEILERASQEAEHIRSQAVATTQLKARTLQLEQREKLLDSVFEATREQLPTVSQWTDYDQIARHLLREAVIHLKASSARIRADETTQKFMTDKMQNEISKELKVQLKVNEPLKQGTGVIAETTDGHLHYDNTLETRLRRLQNTLRSPVFHILMGEPL
jgi:vacuolar-type H+-ATPase subunit E/Vma4